MSMLPNILPAIHGNSLSESEASVFPGPSGKSGEPFGDLMSRILLPGSKKMDASPTENQSVKIDDANVKNQRASDGQTSLVFPIRNQADQNSSPDETASDDSALPSKGFKSGSQTTDKDHTKTTDGDSQTALAVSVNIQNSIVAANPLIASVQVASQQIPATKAKGELAKTITSNVVIGHSKAAGSGKGNGVSINLPETKGVSKNASGTGMKSGKTGEINSQVSATGNAIAGDLIKSKVSVPSTIESGQKAGFGGLSDLDASVGKTAVQAQSAKNLPDSSVEKNSSKTAGEISSNIMVAQKQTVTQVEAALSLDKQKEMALDASNASAVEMAKATDARSVKVAETSSQISSQTDEEDSQLSSSKVSGQPGAGSTEIKNVSLPNLKVSAPVISQSRPGVDTKLASQLANQSQSSAPNGNSAIADKTNLAASQIAQVASQSKISSQAAPLSNNSGVSLTNATPVASPTASAPGNSFSTVSDANTNATGQVDGTPVAQQYMAMKNADKTNKIAGLTEKVLPGRAGSSALKNNLPAHENGSDLLASRLDASAASATGDSSANRLAGMAIQSANTAVNVSAAGFSSQALDNTHDLVALHALRLSDSNAGALQVVIKPDGGTQLSLSLHQQGDGIEVQAVMQHGDFNHLNQHWSELQQRLEQRGIRLAPLTGDGNFASGGNGGGWQNQHRQFARQDSLSANAFTEFVPVGSTITTPATSSARAAVHPGWETWA
jgi:hypothetical protein